MAASLRQHVIARDFPSLNSDCASAWSNIYLDLEATTEIDRFTLCKMLQGCKNCRAAIQPSYCLESVQFLRIAGHPFIHGCHCSCLRFVSWCEVSTTSTAMRTWQLRATGWLNEVAYGMTNESQVSCFFPCPSWSCDSRPAVHTSHPLCVHPLQQIHPQQSKHCLQLSKWLNMPVSIIPKHHISFL